MPARTYPLGELVLGGILLAAGLAGMAALMVVLYGSSAVCERLALRLGLSLSLLLSAVAQTSVLLGGWLLARTLGRDRAAGTPRPPAR